MTNEWTEGLIGHAAVLRILSSATLRPAPSYLLHGPGHAGKRTCAARFIQRLLGCGIDDPKWRIHPDLIVLEAEEGKSQVSVEQVREARERVSLRPSVAERVVLYVPHADRLNESGTNALLKVVEEPPADAVFVFVAEDVSRIPQTLRSRSVLLPFDIVPRGEIAEGLVARGMSAKEADGRSHAAHGLPGLALSPEEHAGAGRAFADGFVAASSAGARLARIDELAVACESQEDPEGAWRDALLHAMREAGARLADDPARCVSFGIALITALRAVGSAVPPRLPLEALAVRLEGDLAASPTPLFPSPVSGALHPLYRWCTST